MSELDWNEIEHFSRGEFGPAGAAEPDPDLVRRLDEARGWAGVPFVISSGIRTTDENRDLGGAEDSAHVTGHGVDIACSGSRQRYQILRGLMDAGFHRIGIYDRHIHADTSPHNDPRVIWVGISKTKSK